jgi:uncharacterized membrane protein
MSSSAGSAGGVRPLASDPQHVATGRGTSAVVLVRERAWALTVWAAMVVWAITLFDVARDRHADFRFASYDLGNMVQAVWSTAHGRPLEETNGYTGEQMIRLGSHVDPILAALAPLWLVWPSPLMLAAVQIAVVALGALPMFWLGRRHLGSERVAALLALAYLAYPWIAWTAVDAFHPVTLAIPLLLFCVWFLDTDRLLFFAVCAGLTMATGELMGIVVASLGVWYALARHRRSAGLLIAIAGTAWTLVALYVIVPAFSGGASVFYGLYENVGGTPWGVVRTTFTDPGTVLSAVTRGTDFLYVVLLAAPLAGAFLLAPALAAVALPQLAVNVLADISSTIDPHEHYVAGILPFLFAAIAVGLGRLSPSGRGRGAVLVLTLSLATTAAVGPWPGTLLGAPNWDPLPSTSVHIRAVDRAVALVPAGAPVSATNRVGSHLGDRRYYYSVPVIGRAEWIVLESADTWIPQAVSGRSKPATLIGFKKTIEQSPRWLKIFDEDGVLVFRKVRA